MLSPSTSMRPTKRPGMAPPTPRPTYADQFYQNDYITADRKISDLTAFGGFGWGSTPSGAGQSVNTAKKDGNQQFTDALSAVGDAILTRIGGQRDAPVVQPPVVQADWRAEVSSGPNWTMIALICAGGAAIYYATR